LATTRAADLVYVYTKSKVVAASKKKDEKKWYKDNVESEASDAEFDEEDVEDGPHLLDGDGKDNDMYNWNFHGEMVRSPIGTNEEFRGNNTDTYNFHSDEDNDVGGFEVLSIVRCMDGIGYLNSENILFEKGRCLRGDTRGQCTNACQWWAQWYG